MTVTLATSQNIDQQFDDPFFTGTAAPGSNQVPGVYQVAIDGHAYIIDPKHYNRVTVPLRRESTDESVEPGEQTLNTGGAWRRSQDNWFMGAGQEYLDNRFAFVSVYTNSGEDPSVRTRFWRSKGVDPWTEGALSLLPLQDSKGSSASSTQFLEAVGSDLYWWDGTNLKVTTNPSLSPPTWTTVTEPLSLGSWPTVYGLASDGANLYIALGDYGVATCVAGSSTTATILRPTAPTPTLKVNGTSGTTTYTYYVVAVDANGFRSLVSSAGTITTGPSSLSSGDSITVSWTAVDGAVKYEVLKADTAHIITTVTTNTFTDDGTLSSSSYTAPTNTTDTIVADFVGYGNGFLLAAHNNLLVQVGANGMTTLVMEHFNPSFIWNACTGSPTSIYVTGYAGDVSELYGIQLSTQTFGLGAPYIAGAVSDGEIINDLCYYQGVVILATSLGVRTAQDSNSNGMLTTGAVINDLGASECCVPWENFVYYGVSNFNENDGIFPGTAVSSGLGRLFLSEFSNPLIPAYTSDAMATDGTTGTTVACAVVSGIPYFAIAGSGVWGAAASGDLVSTGYLQAGWVRYGTVENKILVSTDLRHDGMPAGGSITIDIVPFNGQSFTSLVSSETGSIGPNGPVSAGNPVGEAFHLIVNLNRATNATQGPVLRRWTTRAIIIAARQDQILVPIIWADEVDSPIGDGVTLPQNLMAEWQFLKALEASGAAFIYQEGALSYTAQIDQIELDQPYGWNDEKSMMQGILIVKLLTVN